MARLPVLDASPGLFDDPGRDGFALAPGASLLRGWACARAPALLAGLRTVLAAAPLRHMHTPGGRRIVVANSNCGALGWVSDAAGYRYSVHDPLTGHPWPALPPGLFELAQAAAAHAGYPGFAPNACLINRYRAGDRLSLHQDRNEGCFEAPIVSLSFGLDAVFLFGGLQRTERCRRWLLRHGDAVVWGGPARLAFHGVEPLSPGRHPATGACRINLSLRQVQP